MSDPSSPPLAGAPSAGRPPAIRRARRTDFERLAALAAWPGVDGSAARSTRLYRRIVNDLAYDLYVAEDAGEILGVVAVSHVRSLSLGGQRSVLEELWVRPEARRRGLGRRLLEFVRRRAAKRGTKAFEASAEGPEAEAFLAASGFAPRGRRWRLEAPEVAR